MNSEIFYQQLLEKALQEIRTKNCNAIVFGPLKTQTEEFEKNLKSFRDAQNHVTGMGYIVFDQIPYLDIYLDDAPYDFDKKFPIFFAGLIKSNLLKDIFFTHDYKTSPGAITEHEYCSDQKNITVHYL